MIATVSSTNKTSDWVRVSVGNPCPICEKNTWCGVSADGRVAVCMRIESDRTIDCDGAGQGWLHRLDGGDGRERGYIHPSHLRRPQPAKSKPDYPAAEIIGALRAKTLEDLTDWADKLGLSADSLFALGCGLCKGDLLTPEVDENGEYCGIQFRYEDGQKISQGGRGLYLCEPPPNASGSLAVTEGAGDTAAARDLGLAAIGKPSATGGNKLLTPSTLLDATRGWNWNREITVIADRGEVGERGARDTADHLAAVTGRRVSVILPGDQKDLRDYLKAGLSQGVSTEQLRRQLLLTVPIYVVEPPKSKPQKHGRDCDCQSCADVSDLRRRIGDCHRYNGSLTLFHPEKGEVIHARLRCKGWSCPGCRPLLELQWLEHFHEMFDREQAIYRVELSADKWQALQKKIQRAGGQYVRIKIEDDLVVVFSNIEVDGGERLSAGKAKRILASDLQEIDVERRPVSTSKGWKLIRENAGYELIDTSASYEPDAHKAVAAEHKLTHRNVSRELFAEGISIDVPRSWTSGDVRRFVGAVYDRVRKDGINVSPLSPLKKNKERDNVDTTDRPPVKPPSPDRYAWVYDAFRDGQPARGAAS